MIGIVTAVLCAATAVLLTIALIRRRKGFRFFEERGVPGPKPGLVFGNSLEFYRDVYGSFARWGQKYSKDNCYGIFVGTSPFLVTTDLDFIQRLLIKDFTKFHQRSAVGFVDIQHPIFGRALVGIGGQEWKTLRTSESPVFTTTRLKSMVPSLQKNCDKVVQLLKQRDVGEFDILPLLRRLQLDTLAKVLLGTEVNSLDNLDSTPHLLKSLTYCVESLACRWINHLFMAFQSAIPFARFCLANGLMWHPINNGSEDVFKILKDRTKVPSSEFILLNALLNASQSKNQSSENKKAIHPNSLAADSFMLTFAAYETLSLALGFTVYHLARNPEIQDKLRAEIRKAYQESGHRIDYEVVNSVEYLSNVIDESLRIDNPISLFTTRSASEEFEHNGVRFPAGTNIIVPMQQLHYNPEYFPDPDRFDPDRFSSPRKHSIPKMAYQPFGDGPRHCIGKRISLFMLRFQVFNLLLNFRFTPGETPSNRKNGGIIFNQLDHIYVKLAN